MPQNGPRPPLGEMEIEPVAERLAAIYRLAAHDAGASDGNSRAAWCIGEALGACGGYDLMWLVYRMFEERNGLSAGQWLDRSWNGIEIENVVVWKADGSPPASS